MDPDQIFIDDRYHHEEVVKSLVQKFADYSGADLSAIITRYISYEPESVRAALYLLVEKGLISYDFRELLWQQIDSNFKAHNRHIKSYGWEKNNAFIKYVAAYTDDQIYDIIEKPDDIVIDVFFAVLTVAKERALISEEDFRIYRQDAKLGIVTEHVPGIEEIDSVRQADDPENMFDSEEELEAEKAKFWKCPKCNQLVGMEFGACWNCEAEAPSVVEHPDREDIIKDHKETLENTMKSNPIRSGFIVILLGLGAAAYEQHRHYYSSFANHTRFIGVIFGLSMALMGLFIVVVGFYLKSKRK